MSDQADITRYLRAWRDGDESALKDLTPLIYNDLRAIAANLFRHEDAAHTLQPTALVHEAFPRLAAADITWQDRSHFFATAARILRHVLIDHARAKQAQKRGGDLRLVTYTDAAGAAPSLNYRLLDLDHALEQLAELDRNKVELFELMFFGGLGLEEISEVAGVSVSTVQRELRFTRSWLTNRLRS